MPGPAGGAAGQLDGTVDGLGAAVAQEHLAGGRGTGPGPAIASAASM